MSLASSFPAIRPALLLDFANAKTLDPRVTFTRASSAVYYDDDTMAKAEENLFLQSENFSSWSISNATRTTGVTDPAGGTTAATITKTADDIWSLRTNVSMNTQNATFTLSVWLKGTGTVNLRADNFVNQALSQAVTLTSTWTRYSFTNTFNGTGSQTNGAFGINMASGTTATSFDVAFAQLELRNAATAYTPTTTAPITNYIPVLLTAASGVPRFDRNPVTRESLGLLIEESRTNLLAYSEQFDNAYWTKTAVTVLPNQTIAPDGTLTADALIVNASTTTHQISRASVVASSVCAASIYAKAAGVNTFTILDGTGTNGAAFNLATGLVTNVGTGVGLMIAQGNGWYRCISIATTTGFRLYCPTPAANATGDGFNGIFIWGAQLEAGSFATSYIATAGSQVTRSTDQASMTGANFSSWYNNAEGTFYANFVTSWSAALPNTVGVLGADSANERINYIPAGSSGISSFDGTTVRSLTSSVLNINAKVATSLIAATNQVSGTSNGASVNTGSFSKTGVLSVFNIGNLSTSGGNAFSGTFKKIAYYPQRLTDAQLQALTA
jgi:hypothetical protein